MFDAWADVSNALTVQYYYSELGNTLFSAHTTIEYVACYSHYFVVSGKINRTTYWYVAS